jgi:hypothetical protein
VLVAGNTKSTGRRKDLPPVFCLSSPVLIFMKNSGLEELLEIPPLPPILGVHGL